MKTPKSLEGKVPVLPYVLEESQEVVDLTSKRRAVVDFVLEKTLFFEETVVGIKRGLR